MPFVHLSSPATTIVRHPRFRITRRAEETDHVRDRDRAIDTKRAAKELSGQHQQLKKKQG
jgi:hypothetical protein